MENPVFLNDADVPESTVTPLHIRMLNNLGYTDPSTDDGAQKDQSNVRTVSGGYGACVDGRSKGTEKESKALFSPPNGDGEQLPLSATTAKLDSRSINSDRADGQDDLVCGFGPCAPSFLQNCMSIGYFTVFYSIAGILTSALNVYMTTQITTLEKNFNFSSSFSGFLMSCNDLGYLLTTLSMSYYTRRVHIPRALSLSTIIFGLSGMLCVMAYVVTKDETIKMINLGDNDGGKNNSRSRFFTQMCDRSSAFDGTPGSNKTCEDRSAGFGEMPPHYKWLALAILAFGMFVQGVSKSPRHPFLGTFIDDNVPKTATAGYLGVITAFSILGPAIAFISGGLFSRIYVTLEDVDLSVRDPRWIGAWWLGFLVFGGAALVSALPIAFFPRRLKGRRYVEEAESQKKEELHKEKKTHVVANDIKGFLKSLRRLLLNPVFSLIALATGIGLMGIGGFMSFAPKYMEAQFTVSVFRANVMLGSVNVLSAGVGTVLGGLLASRFKMSPIACLRFVIACLTVSTLVLCLGFVLGCDQPYIESGSGDVSPNSLSINQCVADCDCDSKNFFPVCGGDNRNYFSPCHAGCTDVRRRDVFLNCSCIMGNETQGDDGGAVAAAATTRTPSAKFQQAVAGLCTPDCKTFYPYGFAMFAMVFFGTIVIMPTFVIYVRSVEERDKPLAIGFMAFTSTGLGWLPGPVVFGILVDTTCRIWKISCSGDRGACSLYDLPTFRFRYHFLLVALRLSSIVLFMVVLTIVTFSKKFKFQAHTDEVAVPPPKENEVETYKSKDNSTELTLQKKF